MRKIAQITYALRVALEWIVLVLTVLIAVAIMLLASVLYWIHIVRSTVARGAVGQR